jgi:hypothetical protein
MMGVFYTPALPVCRYTMGQMGLADENENSIPDIYETKPEIAFVDVPGINPDTIYMDQYVLGARITSPAIPNRNFRQCALCPDEMIDYAAPLAGGTYWINSQFDHEFEPSDGAWDESREDIGRIIAGFDPGLNLLNIEVTNCVGVTSRVEREIYLVGLKYYSTTVRTTESGMELGWVTASETFGAVFEVEKQDLTAGAAPVIIDIVTTPHEIGAKKKCFICKDESIIPTHEYRYRIKGRFDLEIEGELRHFEFLTPYLFHTAMIPLGSDFVSPILPNPAREYINFTVDVPCSYYDPATNKSAGERNLLASGGVQEQKTFLDIRIYNANGQLVRTLYSRERFGGIKTVRWDCVDTCGRNVSPGVYFIRVKVGERQAVRKVVVLR